MFKVIIECHPAPELADLFIAFSGQSWQDLLGTLLMHLQYIKVYTMA